MAQLMAGAQRDEVLARAARYAMDLWRQEVETVVRRVLEPSPLADVVDPAGLARAISAAFIGLELYEGVDPDRVPAPHSPHWSSSGCSSRWSTISARWPDVPSEPGSDAVARDARPLARVEAWRFATSARAA